MPFRDGEFDVVTCIDTLEHIAPADRAGFLSELVRVSKQIVVVGAPFYHEATARLEHHLNEAYRTVTGQEHPWLGEHVCYGLPDLAATLAILGDGREVATCGSAPLDSWALAQWATVMEELLPGLRSRLSRLTDGTAFPWELLAREFAETGRCADYEMLASEEAGFYRTVIVAGRGIAAAMGQLPSRGTTSGALRIGRAEQVTNLCSAIVSEVVETGAGGGDAGSAINESLARALRALPDHERRAGRKSRFVSLLRRLLRQPG